MNRSLPRTLLISLSALLASSLARASETAEPVRIEFRGATDCPDKDAFMASVRSRSARIREASPGEDARAFQVTLSRQTDKRFHGELAVVDMTPEGQAERARSIDGDSCEEIVAALALFTVLSVDPAAVLGEQGDVAVSSEPATLGPVTAEPPPLVASIPPVDRAPAPTPHKTPPAHDNERALEYRAVAGLHGGIMAVGAPTVLSAGSAFFEFGLDDRRERGLTFHPVARLSLLMTPETSISTPAGVARLRWTTLALDLCPLVVRGTHTLALRPCVIASGDILHAAGEIAEPKTATVRFPTLGGAVRGEFAPAETVLIELAFRLEFPLRRDGFYFEPATPIYEVPAVIGLATLGGGFRFL